jgi:hypothetical protein
MKAQSGDGLITVTYDGLIQSIHIDRDLLAAKVYDLTTLEKLIAEAVNESLRSTLAATERERDEAVILLRHIFEIWSADGSNAYEKMSRTCWGNLYEQVLNIIAPDARSQSKEVERRG